MGAFSPPVQSPPRSQQLFSPPPQQIVLIPVPAAVPPLIQQQTPPPIAWSPSPSFSSGLASPPSNYYMGGFGASEYGAPYEPDSLPSGMSDRWTGRHGDGGRGVGAPRAHTASPSPAHYHAPGSLSPRLPT